MEIAWRRWETQMKKRSRLWLGLLAAGLGAAVAAAQTFVESTQVVVVEVPVQVIRDGEPVRGLTAADFEVFDGRDKQTLTGFEAVDLAQLGGDALATAELPSSARRHFLVLFDLTFSRRSTPPTWWRWAPGRPAGGRSSSWASPRTAGRSPRPWTPWALPSSSTIRRPTRSGWPWSKAGT